MTTRELLEQLIGFDTVSRNPNKALMDFVANWLQLQGIESKLIPNADGSKANLYATVVGNEAVRSTHSSNSASSSDSTVNAIHTSTGAIAGASGGVMLSGHTDVVPIDGQNWSVPAFALTEHDGKYYGRGTADMKGFVACALTAMSKAHQMPLKNPLHLALSYDEEIGCVGVQSLVEHLRHQPGQPALCIVGEPTQMSVAIRHKGKCAVRATFTGREGHSALAPHSLNAIHLACDFISQLRTLQDELATPLNSLDKTQVPYTTVHAGIISGGTALNIVPNRCTVDFEIRNTAEVNAHGILAGIKKRAEHLVTQHVKRIPECSVSFEIFNEYPGLNTPEDSWAVQFVKSLAGANDCSEVAFGTEAGLFSSKLSIPSVICGPGSMAQGHKPDEFISIDQMALCEQMLDRLLSRLCKAGL